MFPGIHGPSDAYRLCISVFLVASLNKLPTRLLLCADVVDPSVPPHLAKQVCHFGTLLRGVQHVG